MVLEMRRSHPYWGARRIAFELARKKVEPVPSESGVYRCLSEQRYKAVERVLAESQTVRSAPDFRSTPRPSARSS
jgi:hypothetical protein